MMFKLALGLLQLVVMAQARVVVVGGGLAGLTAVLKLADQGVPVTVIEGEKNLGGNSAKASSGINGCGTDTQEKLGIKDDEETFIADTTKAGDQENDPVLVKALVRDSKMAIDWLVSKGVALHDVNLCGGHANPRTHWIPSPKEGKPIPVGFEIIKQLKARLAEAQAAGSDIEVFTLTHAVGLIAHDGRVTGLTLEIGTEDGEVTSTRNIDADAVILTTGGFSNDHTSDSLLDKYAPLAKAYPTTNGPFATGSGIKMVQQAIDDVKLVGMGYVQIHPTGFIDPAAPAARTKFLAAEALRGSGAILLNHKGQRFANELGRRDHTTQAIKDSCAKSEEAGNVHIAYLLMNKESVDKFGWPAFNFYFKIKKFFKEFDNSDALAKDLDWDPAVLRATLADYSSKAASGTADEFGKTKYPIATFDPSATLFIARVTPSIHYTMGGLAIDEHGHVLNKSGRLVPGLFAAGEVSGGVHGSNRLGGNSLLECVVFGTRAAQTAGSARKHNEL